MKGWENLGQPIVSLETLISNQVKEIWSGSELLEECCRCVYTR